jgi:hypothetical protein
MLSFLSVEDVTIFHGVNVIIFEGLDVFIFECRGYYHFSGVNVIIFQGLDVIIFECKMFQEKEKRGELITINDNIK